MLKDGMAMPTRLFAIALASLATIAVGCRRATSSKPAPAAPSSAEESGRCEPTGWCVVKGLSPGRRRIHVWAAADDDVWLVGETVERGDGRTFREVANLPPAKDPELTGWWSARGASRDAVWLAGRPGNFLWDGKTFSERPRGLGPDPFEVLGPNDVWTVSTMSGSPSHWDGKSWKEHESLHVSLAALHCSEPKACWAAGGKRAREGLAPGSIALRYDGKEWRRERLPEPVVIRALSGTGAGDVWAVGGRAISHFDGTRWRGSPSRFLGDLTSVQARAKDDVWAASREGVVLHYDGTAWAGTQVTDQPIVGLALSAHHAFVLDAQGQLFRRSGSFAATVPPRAELWAPSAPSAAELEAAIARREQRYEAALGRGRQATQARRFDLAEQAFVAALEARPDDAQALSERAYARRARGDHAGAKADLERAAELTDDRKLRAQIYFNLGLSLEAERAHHAFIVAHALQPSAATQSKLRDATACPVAVQAAPAELVLTAYSDWLALAKELIPSQAPSSNDAAEQALCRDSGCGGTGPWLVGDPSANSALVVRHGGGLRAVVLATASGGAFCPINAGGEVLYDDARVSVIKAWGGSGIPQVSCFAEDDPDSLRACTESEQEHMAQGPEFQRFIRGCDWTESVVYVVYDKAAAAVSLKLEPPAELLRAAREQERYSLTASAEGVDVVGPGCTLHRPYAKKP